MPRRPVQLDHLVVLDQRVRQQALAHLRHLRRVVHVQLDQPPDMHVLHALEAERRQRALDGLPLRVEDALLGADQDPRPHAGALQPRLERLAGDPLVGVDVQLARPCDHVVGERGRGRRLVPAGAGRPVAHVLLVEARLAVAGLVAVGRPEARRVGRQHLVAEHDRAVGAAAELELRVGEDDPALARVRGAELVDGDRQAAQLLEQLAVADDLGGAVEVHVLVVVAHLGLGGGREDRLGELLGLPQARRAARSRRPRRWPGSPSSPSPVM